MKNAGRFLRRHRLLAGAAVALVVVVVITLRLRSSRSGQATDPATLVPVSVTPIVLTTLRAYVETWGTVEPEPATPQAPPASARVASPVSGIVAAVRCAEGQRVRQGQLLFALDSRVADVAVARARQALKFAELAFERQQKLGPGEATSQKLYQEAEQNLAAARNELATAEAQRALLDVRAPLSGTVVKVNAKPGDAVDLTTGLAEIIDLDRLVVTAGVRSADVARVRRGQRVALTAESSLGGAAAAGAAREASGVVAYVGAQIDSRTDNAPVRVSLPRGAAIRPGQFLKVRIAVEERRNRLAVPVESVVTESGVSRIVLLQGDRAIWRTVTLGVRDGNLVEVAGASLKAGMPVVTSGSYGVPNESRIRVVPNER